MQAMFHNCTTLGENNLAKPALTKYEAISQTQQSTLYTARDTPPAQVANKLCNRAHLLPMDHEAF